MEIDYDFLKEMRELTTKQINDADKISITLWDDEGDETFSAHVSAESDLGRTILAAIEKDADRQFALTQ